MASSLYNRRATSDAGTLVGVLSMWKLSLVTGVRYGRLA